MRKKSLNVGNFYSIVHHLTYKYPEISLKRYRIRLKNELNQFGKKEDFLKNKTILDIGTGFQGLVALEMGAKKVIHIDINSSQINKIKKFIKLYKKANYSKKIIHHKVNLSNFDVQKIGSYDIVIMFGIINHLSQPIKTLKKLQEKLNNKGQILIRAYDGKSTTRKVINSLRQYSKNIDRKIFINEYYRKYKKISLTSLQLADALDDLYSPIVNNFSFTDKSLILKKKIKYDENLRFIINKEFCNFDKIIHFNCKSWLVSNKFFRDYIFNSKIIIKIYEIIRRLDYFNLEKKKIETYLTGYKQNDYMKLIFIFHLLLKERFNNEN